MLLRFTKASYLLAFAVCILAGCTSGQPTPLPDTGHSLNGGAVVAENTWPGGLPVDAVQPWEQVDAGGKVIAGINGSSEFSSGVERFDQSGADVTDNVEASHLTSGAAGSGALSWASYRLIMGGMQPGVISADVNLLEMNDGKLSGYYVGLSNYGDGAWDWRGPFTDSHVRLSTGADVLAGADYLSSLGNLFVCVVAHDGAVFDVVGVGANPVAVGDTTPPDAPVLGALTPVAGGLEIEWLHGGAADLAGFRIYHAPTFFADSAIPGVVEVTYLEGGNRHLLTGSESITYVRVAAVDITGNESSLSDIMSATPLAGDPPSIELVTDVVSGLIGTSMSLTATGADIYDWDLDGDGVFEIAADATGAQSVTPEAVGIIRPAVRGTAGGSNMLGFAAVSLIIGSNARPVVQGFAEPAFGVAPLMVQFTSNQVDLDGDVAEWLWDFTSNGTVNFRYSTAGGADNPAPYVFTTPGLYNAKVRCWDNDGAWDVDTVTILVEAGDPVNVSPAANLAADKTTSYWPFTINFDGSGSGDPDGSIVLFEWDFDGDGSYEEYGPGAAAAYTYPVYGLYTAGLRVTDDLGAQGDDSLLVTLPSEWWMFGMEQTHNRRSPYVGAQTNNVKWSYPTGSNVRSSPAIGADGTVYVGSNDDNLYAINPDGSLKWSYTTGSDVESSPAIGADGTVYVGSRDGNLYAINPDSSLKWSYTTGNSVDSSPAIGADGTVYVGDDNYILYAINPDGSLKWSYTTGDYFYYSSPAIGADGTVYAGSNDDNLYAINPDGSLKWSYTTGNDVESSPAIGADGTIYVGSEDNNFYAINPDCSLKWLYTTGDDVESSPAIGADGTIYVGSNDDNLYAFNPDGSVKWSYDLGLDVRSSPAIGADGTIYVGSMDDKLYALNPDSSLKWSYTTGNSVESSPAIGADGTVYVGSSDGLLYAFGPTP